MPRPSANQLPGTEPARLSLQVTVWLACIVVLTTTQAIAFDLSGSASLFFTSLDNRGTDSDLTDEQASFSLFQTLTPYVHLRLGYSHLEYHTQGMDSESSFSRRFREPRLELLYNRDRLTGRLELRERTADGTFSANNFESSSLLANISWRPRRGPGFSLAFRDESNIADQSVFGRDTDTQFLTLETFYNKANWGVSYSYRNSQAENLATRFDSEQDRHELRGRFAKRVANDRLSVSLSTSVSRLERLTTAAAGVEFGEPVSALDGLFAIDTSPEIGELESTAGLVDGNVSDPAAPGIDIGGGNTFRNLGVSLPVISPVSQLEISVAVLSGASLLWQVYESADGLSWTSVAGSTTSFDPALLRYTIRFPEVLNRFFKAVNVSVNPEPTVQVTEIRALLDRQLPTERVAVESTLYRADFATDYQATEKISAGFNLGLSSDEDLTDGFVRRDFNEVHGGARLAIELHEQLHLRLGYLYSDSENLREPAVLRTVDTLVANLNWTPLPTVDAVLSAQQREESAESVLLQSTRSTRLVVSTDLLPDLRLITDLESSTVDSPFIDAGRDGWSWSERLEASPTRRWTVGGGYRLSHFEDSDGELLFEYSDIDLRSTWLATAYLTLTGTWGVSDQGDSETVRQSYNLSYNPGPKFTLSALYNEFSTNIERVTASRALSSAYRLHNNLGLFATLNQSEFGEGGDETDRISSLRAGLRLFF